MVAFRHQEVNLSIRLIQWIVHITKAPDGRTVPFLAHLILLNTLLVELMLSVVKLSCSF